VYLSTVGRTREPGRRPPLKALGSTVFALGLVSLVTDISSEMVTAVLPVYLVLSLHLSPAAYGVVDGLYTGATALLRIVGGYIADRVSAHKTVAGIGYALSAVTKLGLLLAGSSAPAIGATITVDRAGKGLRTAPRDALITLSAPSSMLGKAFGVHRTMDSIGAFAGPLVALAVLAAVGSTASAAGFNAVFVTSFCFGVLGVLFLVLFVKNHRETRPASTTVSPRAAADLLRDPRVRKLLAAAIVLGLSTIGDGFVYLLLQRREDLSIGWFPVLAVGTNLAYLLLAAPLGALADRIGRLPVVLGGYGALVVVYLLLFGPLSGLPMLVLTLGLYGLFYASTDGVLMALAGPILPKALRTTGIALIQTGQSIAYFVSSVLFGLAWQFWGPVAASRAAAVVVVVAIIATAGLLATKEKQ
jgi:MFS family permease